MNFPSIDIQGSIISADLLSQIRSEQAPYQQGNSFKSDFTTAKLKDEISFAWQEVKGQWAIYQSKLARLKEGETGTTETRNFWISPLLTNLGYNLIFSRQSEEINGRNFPIGFRDSNLDGFPVYIGGYHESLDRRPENKQLRVSPHAMVQEYLNACEHVYGIVTNGRQLRLLRDASRITRLSYVEFNLQKIMEEDLYADFVILYRLLQASRMPVSPDAAGESIIEKYHEAGLEAGSTIRSKLGDAVKEAIKSLANGFINHPDNGELRRVAAEGNLDMDEYYRHQLRIIYRLLFLFVIEERNLVYGANKSSETKRFNQIYFNYYSLHRLRKLARKLTPPEAARHYDLWQALISTFALFESKEIGEKLGIMALKGDLFSYEAISCPHYDLHQNRLSNAVLLNILKALSYFENENKVLVAVNYGGLDVEEFGSVYEGLLELKLKIEPVAGRDEYRCSFEESSERSKSGSHYTPEELVQPLIKHSLDYLIADKLKEKDPEAALLSLKVCDVACGSGHILLSAARRIALELASLKETKASGSKEKVEQPSPAYIRLAMKEVIKHCIYGVDKNPLAIELCKIALWLESYNPGEPLNFLDHHIKCGDAIVGLANREELENGIANEAFKTLPGDDKEIAAAFRQQNQQQRKQKDQNIFEFETVINDEVNTLIEKFNLFKNLPETTPEEVEKKAKQYFHFQEKTIERLRLKQLADAQVAQFFLPKTEETKSLILTDEEYRSFLRNVKKGFGPLQSNKLSFVEGNYANSKSKDYKNLFHWFIEFPEVFSEGGFDCILGNPPFLGGQKLSGNFGDPFLECIKYQFAPIGAVDLVTYFFRRIFDIIKKGGFLSLISTNTIAQGRAREDGLDIIIKRGGVINHAIKSMKWPGVAAVEVALVTITKQQWKGKRFLSGKEVKIITPYLDDAETIGDPFKLKENEDKSFQGSIVLGKGFVLEPHKAKDLIAKNPKNKEVLFPYLNGDDLNNSPEQLPSRWVINFFNAPLSRYTSEKWLDLPDELKVKINESLIERKSIVLAPNWYGGEVATDFHDCFKIVDELVKPERIQMKGDRGAEYWWQFLRIRNELYNEIKKLNYRHVLVQARVSKTHAISFVDSNQIFSDALVVFNFSSHRKFLVLQSSIHEEWTWKYSSTMKGDRRYTPSDCFETFPFPKNLSQTQEQQLETIGDAYHEHRRQLMLAMQLGLTKTYNAFHAKEIQSGISDENLQSLDKKSIEKEYGKEVWYLWNHLQKMKNPVKGEAVEVCSMKEAIAGIVKLRELHVQMDKVVLEAYGWGADSDQPILLKHDFYEVDYLPENDRVRYTIHPDARKEVLKRLLELNHQIHEEEVKAGLWDKKGKKKYKVSDSEGSMVDEPDSSYGGLFKQD